MRNRRFSPRFLFPLSLPLPGGLLIPTMVVGAAVGRVIGELMELGAVSYGAGVFAVVGAAGFCAAVTQSLSLIIIVFELTGQLFFLAPLIVTVVPTGPVAGAKPVMVGGWAAATDWSLTLR